MASVEDIPSWEHAAPTLAVSFGRLQEEKWLKAWPGGDLDAKDEEGWSALQRAAAEGLAVAVKELLRRPGVEVNGVEPALGQSALVLASRGGPLVSRPSSSRRGAGTRRRCGCCSRARRSR